MPEEMTEAEAFAEFLENREAFMLLSKAKAAGYRITVTAGPDLTNEGRSIYHVSFENQVAKNGLVEFELLSEGGGDTLAMALREAFIDRPQPSIHQRATTTALLRSADDQKHGVPGLQVPFTVMKPETILISATIHQASDSPNPWEPEYEVLIVVDGNVQGQSVMCSPQAPGSVFVHQLQRAVQVAAGSHVVELMYARRPTEQVGQGKLVATAKFPGVLTVQW